MLEVGADIETSVVERKDLFSMLYETAFPKVAGFVRQRNGTLENAKDIFQDALVILHEKQVNANFFSDESDEAYLIGIAKHLWIHKFKSERSFISLNDYESKLQIPEDFYPTIESNRLLQFLEITGKKCLELLYSFYYKNQNTKSITKEFGYSSEHSATVQKFKCLEKVREKVKEKTLHYEGFLE